MPSPAILISDIGMPDQDGYSLIARVRQRHAFDNGGQKVPAVALTAARSTGRPPPRVISRLSGSRRQAGGSG